MALSDNQRDRLITVVEKLAAPIVKFLEMELEVAEKEFEEAVKQRAEKEICCRKRSLMKVSTGSGRRTAGTGSRKMDVEHHYRPVVIDSITLHLSRQEAEDLFNLITEWRHAKRFGGSFDSRLLNELRPALAKP